MASEVDVEDGVEQPPRLAPGQSAGSGREAGTSRSHLRHMQAVARRRADKAMQAYTGALGELREDMHASSFESWSLQQLQEFLVDRKYEVRGSSTLPRSSFVAILEKMFKGCTEPPRPPPPLSANYERRRERAARMLQEAWFLKKRHIWSQELAVNTEMDGHLRDNPLHSPRGVMRAAVRGRISEDTPWNPPSMDAAREFESLMHLRRPEGGKFDATDLKTGRYCFLGGCGEQLDLWDEGKTSQFAPFGAGVTSYFKFLKFCSWSFLTVSFAVIPHLFVNTNGQGIAAVSTTTDTMSWTTVGNLGGGANFTEVIMPFCDEEQYSVCVIDKETLGLYYGCLDTLMAIMILAGYFWVHSFIRDEFETIKRNTVTAADFTVMVTHLPKDATEEEISDHFSSLLGRKIVEVAIARDVRKCIDLYARSGRLYHQRASMRDVIRYLITKSRSREDRVKKWEEKAAGAKKSGRGGGKLRKKIHREGWLTRYMRNRKINSLREKRLKASREIINLAAEAKLAAKSTNTVVAAYVTFEEEMAAIDARVCYSGSWLGWLFMKRTMRIRGHRISVLEAPEPSTILWENYGFPRWELRARRTLTFITGASFLTLSIGMSIWALHQTQQAADAGGTAACPSNWDSLTSGEQEDAVSADGSILHCLCVDSVTSLLSLDPEDVCFEYAQASLEATGLVFATSFMVAFTNAAINKITKLMGAFDKHKSMDSQEVSIFRRLVLLKFVNLGLTVLITNSRQVSNALKVDLEYEEDFTSEWYRTLGSSLVLNVVLNSVTPHVYWLVSWAWRDWVWKYKRHRAISQDALNQLTKGSRWEAAVRYAEVTVILAVCLAYSAGIPILLPIGAVSFLVFYWVEKALFVHFYLTPPQYSGKLTNEVISLIPYCLWVHVVFAIYMYGNGSIFPGRRDDRGAAAHGEWNDFAAKIRVKAVQPLLFQFFVLSALIGERWLGKTFISCFAKIVAVLTCKGKIASRELERMCNIVTVDYSRAVVRGILRGLPSYNILLNPKYKESFGLSDSFARQHKRVGSIFMLLREHPSIVEIQESMMIARESRRGKKTVFGQQPSPPNNNATSQRCGGGSSSASPLSTARNQSGHLEPLVRASSTRGHETADHEGSTPAPARKTGGMTAHSKGAHGSDARDRTHGALTGLSPSGDEMTLSPDTNTPRPPRQPNFFPDVP